jgi:hypothetical protein
MPGEELATLRGVEGMAAGRRRTPGDGGMAATLGDLAGTISRLTLSTKEWMAASCASLRVAKGAVDAVFCRASTRSSLAFVVASA